MTSRTMRRRVFGAMTAAALGFGGAQAFAAPAPAAPGKACSDELCNQVCLAASNHGGFCSTRGLCVCLR